MKNNVDSFLILIFIFFLSYCIVEFQEPHKWLKVVIFYFELKILLYHTVKYKAQYYFETTGLILGSFSIVLNVMLSSFQGFSFSFPTEYDSNLKLLISG